MTDNHENASTDDNMTTPSSSENPQSTPQADETATSQTQSQASPSIQGQTTQYPGQQISPPPPPPSPYQSTPSGSQASQQAANQPTQPVQGVTGQVTQPQQPGGYQVPQPSQQAANQTPPPNQPEGYQPTQPTQGIGYQPTQPYQPEGYQVPPSNQQSGYQANPYGQQGGYQPNPYNQAPQYSQNPGYQQNPYEQPKKKRKIWPWVLGGCLLFLVLVIGGCVAFVSIVSSSIEEGLESYEYNYTDPYNYDYDYSYDYDDLDELLQGDSYTSTSYTLDEIKDFADDKEGTVEGGKCSTGYYEVGADKAIPAGLYYLEGSQSEEGEFALFRKNTDNSDYTIICNVMYFGNYYANLTEGDVIVFVGPSDKLMYSAKDRNATLSSTVESGCYQVGVDIPAGTYKVSFQKGSPEDSAQEAGVYVMSDLDWSDSSILESHFLIQGGSHTITVTDGQYVELYKSTMTAE